MTHEVFRRTEHKGCPTLSRPVATQGALADQGSCRASVLGIDLYSKQVYCTANTATVLPADAHRRACCVPCLQVYRIIATISTAVRAGVCIGRLGNSLR